MAQLVIPATWEVNIGRLVVQSQTGHKVGKTPIFGATGA